MRSTFDSSGEIGAEDLDDRRQQARGGPPEHRLGEAILAAEVVVQERLVDARLGGDFLHPGARGAAAEEDGVRGLEDAGLGERVGGRGRRLRAGSSAVWRDPGAHRIV